MGRRVARWSTRTFSSAGCFALVLFGCGSSRGTANDPDESAASGGADSGGGAGASSLTAGSGGSGAGSAGSSGAAGETPGIFASMSGVELAFAEDVRAYNDRPPIMEMMAFNAPGSDGSSSMRLTVIPDE